MNLASRQLIQTVPALLASYLASSQTIDQQETLAKHAALFKFGTPREQRLEDRQPDADGVIRYQHVMIADYMARIQPLTPAQELAELTARVDAVVSGTTVNRYSAPNTLHTALYSDWIVKVTQVYKRASSIPTEPGAEITVTRLGGNLNLAGRRVIYTDPIFPEFTMNHEYVFYLHALPESSSFQAFSGATFDITGDKPLLLTDPKNPTHMREFSKSSKSDFLTSVKKSIVP
jgi:hypothetical protein